MFDPGKDKGSNPGVTITERLSNTFTRRRVGIGITVIALIVALYVCSRPFTPRFRADMFFGRGFWYFRQEDYDTAIEQFTQAIAIRPTHGAALVNRGHAYAALGEDQAALADYDAVIAAYPDVPESYLDRGRVYAHLGDYDAALADFGQAIDLRPYLAVAYYERAKVFEEMGDASAAVDDYERFLALYGLEDDLAVEARTRIEEMNATTP